MAIDLHTYEKNKHKAIIDNLGVNYIKNYNKSIKNQEVDVNPILNNVCLQLDFNALQKIACLMPKLDILLC